MANSLKSLLAWLGSVVAQWIGANLCVFLFSFLWYSEHPTSLAQFLSFVAFIGAGFLIGVYGVGMLILMRRKPAELYARTRFITTVVCIVIPLLALAITGWQITLGDQAEFQTEVIGAWQPNLAQTALWLLILGFHLPGWLKRRPIPVVQTARESI